MEGKALTWYQWWEFCSPSPSWDDFKAGLIKCFQPSMLQSPYELLLSLKQTLSVEEYRDRFELYAGPLRSAEPDNLKGIFLNGLKDGVKAELKLHPVTTLADMMDFSQKIDEKNIILDKGTSSNTHSKPFIKGYPSNHTVTWDSNNKVSNTKIVAAPTTSETSNLRPASTSRGRAFRRLTEAEMQDKMAKNLCFRCDENFVPGHVCVNKQFHVMLMEGDDDDEELAPTIETAADPTFHTLQLSMYSISGFTSKKTIKLWGYLAEQRVLVLVDCGASHNFISSVSAHQQGLSITATPSFSVEVGDGRKIPCGGVCHQLTLDIQGLTIQQDFYVFELGGVDIVLGMEWLAQLGEIRANFGDLLLKVPTPTGTHIIQGDPTLSRASASIKSMYKALSNQGEGFMITYHMISEAEDPHAATTPWIRPVLEDYPEVFTELQGLLPQRTHDYAIILQEGAAIPKLRPYRYRHYQKNEIEKLVDDMLQSGVIRPSVSPYSSPIILVKKKMVAGGSVWIIVP
ncbi:uncharacterized protein LOC131598628 [Vicia villosa]|uniref:uncharacterized protein LOC131598628 n=1 Tax=Vicia villosa TaxID=3911 RepID=UPI00273CB2AE|nr:uncharacterized protein LOC131598628 [Vicia villosa]